MLVSSAIGTVLVLGVAFAAQRALRYRAALAVDDAARARFVARFATHAVPAAILGHTFDVLRARRPGGDAELRPEARLRQDFALSRLDIEDAALVIVERAGGSVPRAADLDQLDKNVATVGDLVGFLAPFGRPDAALR